MSPATCASVSTQVRAVFRLSVCLLVWLAADCLCVCICLPVCHLYVCLSAASRLVCVSVCWSVVFMYAYRPPLGFSVCLLVLSSLCMPIRAASRLVCVSACLSACWLFVHLSVCVPAGLSSQCMSARGFSIDPPVCFSLFYSVLSV